MKKVFALLIGIAACVMVCSCEKETILTVNQVSLSFNNSGGSQTVNIVANKVWSASSNQSWCKVSPSSGDGSDNSNITLSVSCDANTTYDARTCTITITCEELTKTISVSQAEGKGLILSQTEYNLTNDAQTISVEVQANVQYTVEIDNACKNWIKQESTKALSSNIIKFAISKNEEYDGREGKITIKQTDGSLSGTVVVKQSQQNGLFVSTPEYSLSNEKHTLTVEVKANVEFDVKPNVDWIKHVETKGLKTFQIVLEVAANEDYDEREGTVVVKQKGGGLEEVITIKQEQNYGLFVSQSEYSVSNEAQTIDVEVKYNVDYDVVIPSDCKDWISVVNTKGLSSRNYTISIAKNETYDNREGSITFKQKNGSLSGTIKIYQSQTDGIIAERKEYWVSAEEQPVVIKVSSNVEYEVVIDDGCREWLKQIETKGLNDNTLFFRVTKNEGGERQGKITFQNVHVQEIVYVRQYSGGYVEFDDAIFKAYCIEKFDKDGDKEISMTEARNIRRITVYTDNIESIRGIEKMPNIEYLNIMGSDGSKGKLTSIDVSNNLALLSLSCSNNQLTSLDVSKNVLLNRLSLSDNQITNLDISKNTDLTELHCSSNPLSSLDVSNNLKLNWLDCNYNQLTELDVNRNKELTMLNCDYNQLTRIDVSNNTALESLSCTNNLLSYLDVSNNFSMKYLSCYSNPLLKVLFLSLSQSIDYLFYDSDSTLIQYVESDFISFKDVNFERYCLNRFDTDHNYKISLIEARAVEKIDIYEDLLRTLEIGGIKSIEGIEGFTNLNFLRIKGTSVGKLSQIDVSNNLKLEGLECDNNLLTSINIQNNSLLTGLNCSKNLLTSLDVSRNTLLKTIICSENQLKNLDINKNVALHDLSCEDNLLTSIDVSNNVDLTHFYCSNNHIEELNLSNNHQLRTLECSSNKLTQLDVSNNPELRSLGCNYTNIAELDLSNNTFLSSLSCRKTQIQVLDVSNNPHLILLDCAVNPQLKEIWLKKGQTIEYFIYDEDVVSIKYKD